MHVEPEYHINTTWVDVAELVVEGGRPEEGRSHLVLAQLVSHQRHPAGQAGAGQAQAASALLASASADPRLLK